jgi:hypothetical protein
MWTVDSRGWLGISAAEITQRCLDNASPGAIYVFHVGSASQDGPALQPVIDGCARGRVRDRRHRRGARAVSACRRASVE